MTLTEVLEQIRDPDAAAAAETQRRLDRLTKPQGSLGRLEELAVQYCAITGECKPAVPRAMVFTFAGDHGVVEEGVSAYPSDVTAQMVLNFCRGGAGVNVLARHAGVDVRVVDIGVAHEFGPVQGLIHRKLMSGTRNILHAPAMDRRTAEDALMIGIELAAAAVGEGIGLIGTGEMGIGNTTPSAAIAAVMTGAAVWEVTGLGTGIDEQGLTRKVSVIERALATHRPNPDDALDVLSKVGGLEIAGLAGLILGGAAARVPVVLDGFIAGAAALVAVGLQPRCRGYLIASHRSVERGHRVLLDSLGLKPLFDLELRLGEGTGACLGMGLTQAAIKILTEMATFDEAGVSERSA
ncbi:MAG TPA: nicotinate-nucleotide--dimethylbenzimidazole phosphoribosyltransferase [Nitrospira sp.]|jgi:nicotinate-nucleotide--dimethylbenzimidazole phosphoribosyltransferase|nr:nicotinate-nucleotide--dimethylbenzimidazole phosphoribosyltransferase [Nitrospira sp.]